MIGGSGGSDLSKDSTLVSEGGRGGIVTGLIIIYCLIYYSFLSISI